MSAWTVIAHQDLSSAQSTVEFSNIPNGYTDLVLYLSGRTSLAVYRDDMFLRLNGDTNSNYNFQFLRRFENNAIQQSTNSSTSVYAGIFSVAGASATANCFSNMMLRISNYSDSKLKSLMFESTMSNNSSNNSDIYINTGLWNSTNAVTTITFGSLNGASRQFQPNSTATLYGILKGSTGPTTVSAS